MKNILRIKLNINFCAILSPIWLKNVVTLFIAGFFCTIKMIILEKRSEGIIW
jgi:hypothetical protein